MDGPAEVLTKIVAGEREAAAALARTCAAEHPDDLLARALADALARPGRGDVYATPEGFQEFIDHAGNPPLYAVTVAALREIHTAHRTRSLADVGCGDGRVTALVAPSDVDRIDLVEPSDELLRQAAARDDWPVPPNLHATTLAGFVGSLAEPDVFDVVQSTFALHTIEPAVRVELLRALRPHASRVVVVDFDVPDFADRSADHVRYAVERYRRGVDEYAQHPLAVEGFLMPVLVAQFEPGAPRATFEQSASAWSAEFESAGYTVTTRTIHDYWWAPAFVLEAFPRSEE